MEEERNFPSLSEWTMFTLWKGDEKLEEYNNLRTARTFRDKYHPDAQIVIETTRITRVLSK